MMVAILTPDAISAVRLTVEEYFAANLPEGFNYELVNGAVVMVPKPGGEHEDVIQELVHLLSVYRKSLRPDIALITTNANVPIPGVQTVREPDLAVYTEWERGRRDSQVWREFTPVLVIEVVSPDQRRRDYEEKQRDYWKAGISEYWIVEPIEQTVTVLLRQAKAWRRRTIKGSRSFESSAFPGLTVEPARLFGQTP